MKYAKFCFVLIFNIQRHKIHSPYLCVDVAKLQHVLNKVFDEINSAVTPCSVFVQDFELVDS